jgi:hypothetical protein
MVPIVYETDLCIVPTEEGEGAEIRRPVVKATAVVEQRASPMTKCDMRCSTTAVAFTTGRRISAPSPSSVGTMGLAIIGTMTGPLLIVLHTMPAAVFAGVFFIVGWGSVSRPLLLPRLAQCRGPSRRLSMNLCVRAPGTSH